jgi:hypothetical protein
VEPTDSPPDEAGVNMLRSHSRLADLETGLLGLLHFYDMYDRFVRGTGLNEVRAARWYYSALMMHADMLFTVDKGKDPQNGAALRALRDLGRGDLLLELQDRLDQPATPTGLTLGKAIKRLRNDVLVHHSFDMEEQGSALLALGQPDQQSGVAFEALITSVKNVLAEIYKEKLRLAEELFALNLAVSLQHISAAPERARQKERRRRREQGRQAKTSR